MGTYTDFTGAIRITPCLKEPLAGRFRQFLGIRHMKRDVKILEALFPALEERKAVTLFGDGDFGEDGVSHGDGQCHQPLPRADPRRRVRRPQVRHAAGENGV